LAVSIEEITNVIVTHSDALFDQVSSVAVELVLELLLALLGTAADGVDPGLVEPVPGAEATVDFEGDVAV
jgi:hypothetical protein